jgi:macrodomain Ter protein organizer (MatP/YcbG family)
MRGLSDIRAMNSSAIQGDTAKIASLRAAEYDAFHAWLKNPLNPELIIKKDQARDALDKEIMRFHRSK